MSKDLKEKKEFLETINEAYPKLSERQIGYILGVAETVTEKKEEKVTA